MVVFLLFSRCLMNIRELSMSPSLSAKPRVIVVEVGLGEGLGTTSLLTDIILICGFDSNLSLEQAARRNKNSAIADSFFIFSVLAKFT